MIRDSQKEQTSHDRAMRTQYYVIFFLLITVFLSGLYLRFAWNRYQRIAKSEAVVLAKSLEALLHFEHIEKLSGEVGDLQKPEYTITKQSLMRLIETTNPIHFAYILGEQNGEIIILIDSEPAESPDYSPPGQVYEEAMDVLWEPFRSGQTILTEPISDRWGTWISALVPIKEPDKGRVIAVFGIEYAASEWSAGLLKRMLPDIAVTISLLILVYSMLRIWILHTTLKQRSVILGFKEELYRSVFDRAPIGIAIVNDKTFGTPQEYLGMSLNPMSERILGRTNQELLSTSWTEITHPDDLQTDLELFERFQKGEIDGYALEKRFIKPDGSTVWTNMRISHFLGKLGEQSSHLCLLEDVTESRKIREALQESERSKSVLLSHLTGLAYRCNYDREWTMQYVSEGCYGLTGYRPESLLNNRDLSFNDLIAPEFREHLWHEWERVLEKHAPFKFEYEIVTAQGEHKWVFEVGQGIYNQSGEVEALEGIILDISDRKKIENELRYNNEHDRGTGLYNRNYLENLLALDSIKQATGKRAVVSINLSAMQSLTTTYGFHYMQDLVKKTANMLLCHCTDTRRLFNTYENRFVFYMTGYRDKSELIIFCESVANALESLLTPERISGGIGILEIDQDNEQDVDQLLKKLLIASEKAINVHDKDFAVCFYDENMEAQVLREEEIKRELFGIAAGGHPEDLYLQYQPILDLRSNRICGFEALARMRCDKLGLVSPLEFIPIAEKTKLIVPIGEMVMRQAFRFLNRLKAEGYDATHVSINVSVIQLLKKDFCKHLLEMIEETHVQPENIGLEITESVFAVDYKDINGILGELKDAGLHIAIDDFGTGYSSLARERELNINCLKIDKSFIDNLMSIGLEEAITSDVISMAHKLGHCAIAEGVEHEKQRQYLEKFGCDKIQGYLISKPLDEEAAIALLDKHRTNSGGGYSSNDCCCQ